MQQTFEPPGAQSMYRLANLLARSGLLREDLDYRLVRSAMIIIFLFFGYQKWFWYEAQALIPFIEHGLFIAWLHPVFGIQAASWFLGVCEWIICALLVLGFWNHTLGALGALGSIITFACTLTIIPFMPDAWAASSGGFPAMGGYTPFLIKDVVLLAASVYLLRESLIRVPDPNLSNYLMRSVTWAAGRFGLLKPDFAYNLLRASMVFIFLMFGYGKWFEYAARLMVIYITHGPLIFWLYPAFGLRGESRFLGTSEWLTAGLLFTGFWNKKVGMLGSLLSTFTFVSTVTIIPFMPNGWEHSAGGFPAMTGEVPFLMKDVVLLAVSIYLLKQDVVRILATEEGRGHQPQLSNTMVR
jgi:uncharacterized membrane protein YkgB